MLYVSAGDAASFGFNDYGQDGTPVNPCGDPPGGSMTPPTAEGGSLRSQDIRTSGDPQGLDGTILRLDPATGAAAAGNPLSGNSDLNVRKILATGFRNPFRTTIRPGTNEVWAGDVGQGTWEEIDRVDWASGFKNDGWPCYEGAPKMGGFDAINLNICENLYAAGPSAVSAPWFAYLHNQPVAGESCPPGSSSISGLAFYTGTTYPSTYQDALFFADYSRDCIWVMFKGANGLPDPTNVVPFQVPATNPVDLEIGPGGDLFYVDFGDQGASTGTVRRIRYTGTTNRAPTAVASANPTSGPAPLTVNFSGTSSSDPDGDPLTYAWDLDGDGAYDDSTSATPTFNYTSVGPVTVGLRVTDPGGLSGTTTVTVTATSGSGSLTYLSDLTPTTATNGYGPYEKDTSNGEDLAGDGNPMRLGAITYSKGLGVHALSDLRYALASGCTTFAADIGIDEEVGTAGSVIFQVYTDGTKRFESPVLTGASATVPVSVDITGRAQLQLLVQINGSPDFDHADWANARITCGTTNRAPTAVASANPTSGPAPLTVNFSGTGSSDPDGDPLTYAWDLDGDGAYDDSTSATPNWTYATPGAVTVRLRVTDPGGLSGTTTLTVTATNGSGTLTYLSDLTPTTATNGWGPYEKDTSNGENVAGDGNPMRLGAITYSKGLGVHALSDLRYALASGCTTFAADIGIDEEVGTAGLGHLPGLHGRNAALYEPGDDRRQRDRAGQRRHHRARPAPATGADQRHPRLRSRRLGQCAHHLRHVNQPCADRGRQRQPDQRPGAADRQLQRHGLLRSRWRLADLCLGPRRRRRLRRLDERYADLVYSNPGQVTVGLRVTDPGGLSGTTTVTVTATSSNGAPTAVASANPTSGPAPLAVTFSGTGSSDPEGGSLTYAWDLDGDGAYDDSTSATPSWTYATPGAVTVGLKVTDPGSLTGTTTVTVTATNAPPNAPVIDAPLGSLTWAVDDVIAYAGHATDPEDGTLPASALTWTLIMHHCSIVDGTCHTHQIEQFVGVDNGTFHAPDHEYPSHLELKLVATDRFGATSTSSVLLYPKTVDLTFSSAPDQGLQIFVANVAGTTPFTRTVIVNGRSTATAVTPQTIGANTYTFQSWSDGGAASHEITAPTTAATYVATFSKQTGVTVTPIADAYVRSTQATKNFGKAATLQVRASQYRSYLRFTVSGVSGTVTDAKLRLRVTDASVNAGRLYTVTGGWTETGVTWNNAPVISGTPLASLGAATVGTWLEVDVTRLVTGNGTYDLAISDGNSDTTQFVSREGTNPPQLVVTVGP